MLDPHSSGTVCLKGTSVGSDGTRNGSDVTSDGSRGRRAADVEVESAVSGVIGPAIYWLNRSRAESSPGRVGEERGGAMLISAALRNPIAAPSIRFWIKLLHGGLGD